MKVIHQLLILVLLIVFTQNSAISQTLSISLGDNNFYNPSEQYPAPYGRYYESTRQQFLIRSTELQGEGAEAGMIQSIAFYVAQTLNGGDPLKDYMIKLKQTSASSLIAFENSDFTEVYTRSSYTARTEWNTHYFDTPFNWDGSSNVIVEICNGISSEASTNFNSGVYNSSYNYRCYVYAGSDSFDQCDNTTVTGNLYARPDFKMVIKPSVPDCANNVFPVSESTDNSRSLTLDWNATSDYVEDYDLYFGTSANPPFVDNLTSSFYSTGELEGNTTYFWRVVPRNIAGGAEACEIWSFTTTSGLANCSNVNYPLNGSFDIPLNPTLDWASSDLALSYNVYLGTDANPDFVANVTGQSFNTEIVTNDNSIYYWQIEPVTEYGTTESCDINSFTTVSNCPVNPSPVNSQTDNPLYQILSWDSVEDADMYYVYHSADGIPLLIDSTLTNSYLIVDLAPDSQHFWKIETKIGNSVSEACDVWTFSTKGNSHWFVKTDGNDGNDASSWDQAKSSLSEVMFMADVGDSIHVAAGRYFPDLDTLNNAMPTDIRTITFPLKGGVDVLGGYPVYATGSDVQSSLLISRDHKIHRTTLDGDIGVDGDSLDNVYNIVSMFGENSGTALLDGLNIVNGFAKNNLIESRGSGIRLINKQLDVTNCYFAKNATVFVYGSVQSACIHAEGSILEINNSIFVNNYSGLAIDARLSSTLNITNSVFYDNLSGVYLTRGSHMYSENSTYWSTGGDIEIQASSTSPEYAARFISCSIMTIDKSNGLQRFNGNGGRVYFDNCIITQSRIPFNDANVEAKYCQVWKSYIDENGESSSALPVYLGFEYPPKDNGGFSPTCRLSSTALQNFGEISIGDRIINPAIGTGNPAYGGQPDQRGVIRAAVPCIGAYEAAYATYADISIEDLSLCEVGNVVVLAASTSTVSNPVFKWYQDSLLLVSLHTGETYTTPALNETTEYYVTVENEDIHANPIPFAKKATIYVSDLPIIQEQPSAIDACLTNPVSLNVLAVGNNLTYQWFKDDTELTGETVSGLNIASLTVSDLGSYYCQIGSSCGGGNQNTEVAEIGQVLPPNILDNPADEIVVIEETAVLSINVSGSDLSYQWQVDKGVGFENLVNADDYLGVNSDSLIINNVQAEFGEYVFRCTISGTCDLQLISDEVALIIIIPPVITATSNDQEVCLNNEVSFFIDADGTDLEYQWQVKESSEYVNLTDDTTYSGVNLSTLSLNAAVKNLSGNKYRCVVANLAASLNSDAISLSVDEVTPQITSTHIDLEIDANENCQAVVIDYTSDIIATDNCDANLEITQSPVAGSIISDELNTITLTVTDDVDNIDVVSFNVSVVDHTNPQITSVHSNLKVDSDENCEAVLVDYTSDIIAADNCDASLDVTQLPVGGSTISGDINMVTLYVTDDTGNTDEVSFNLSVLDSTHPQITSTHKDIEIGSNANCEAVLGDYMGEIMGMDNCDTSLHVTQSPIAGTTISGAINTILLSVTDDAGNADSVSINVSVVDRTNPEITSTHNDMILAANINCEALIGDYTSGIIAADNCDSSLDVTQSPVVGSIIFEHTNKVTLYVTDDSGNTEEVSFNISVEDSTSPLVTSTHNDVEIDGDNNCEAELGDYTDGIIASDNCDTSLDLTQLPIAGTTISGDTNTVTIFVTDDGGNTNEISFNVLVSDGIVPEMDCLVDSERLLGEGQIAYNVDGLEFDPIELSDNCGIESLVNDFSNSHSLETSEFPIGETTVTWSLTDFSGNETKCVFIIKVNAFEPVLSILDFKEVAFFPNPADKMISFSKNRFDRITISNMQSKILLEKSVSVGETLIIDVSSLKDGLYIINAYENSLRAAKKIIISH